jgi:predicted nucleotidyltransferase component of viral defense system
MTKEPKDVGASVRARLLGLARERKEDFQLVLTRYANERLLFRLAQSPHASRFVLKGAALFTVWTGEPHRATRDIDLLGFGDPSEEALRSLFAEVLALEVAEDGVQFDLGSMTVGPIREDQEYGGVRIVLGAQLTSAKVRLQIDVGFGDAITPDAVVVSLPALLDFPAPRLRAYPRETVVAEKTEAMVKLGLANSRMKDFYDLVILSRMFEFLGLGFRHPTSRHSEFRTAATYETRVIRGSTHPSIRSRALGRGFHRSPPATGAR